MKENSICIVIWKSNLQQCNRLSDTLNMHYEIVMIQNLILPLSIHTSCSFGVWLLIFRWKFECTFWILFAFGNNVPSFNHFALLEFTILYAQAIFRFTCKSNSKNTFFLHWFLRSLRWIIAFDYTDSKCLIQKPKFKHRQEKHTERDSLFLFFLLLFFFLTHKNCSLSTVLHSLFSHLLNNSTFTKNTNRLLFFIFIIVAIWSFKF